MTAATNQRKARIMWLEALRIIAAFLVIVNHTNSDVFQASNPGELTWHLSILWYYVSKLAVPVYVMITGALMLSRQDSWKKILARVLRVVIALFCASYVYYLYDAWVNWGLWPRAVRLDILLGKILRMEITDGFWYLYFYLAVLVTMPLWQWLHRCMNQQQRLCLIAFCFTLNAALPLIGHYVPRLSLLENPLLPYVPLGYLGLLFAGDQVMHHLTIRKRTGMYAAIMLAAALIAAWLLTWLEYGRVQPGEKYWFMDHRMIPALPVIVEAIAAMVLAKCIGERSQDVQGADQPSGRQAGGSRVIAELGGCAFGIYLAQDLLIAETEKRLFLPLLTELSPMVAVLIWEVVVFAVALVAIWLLRRIPLLRRIL
ncbi:MAG: acyltransferase [Clostridiales bacterium]|nr:acyltransferase [Clostridiales bacterium]